MLNSILLASLISLCCSISTAQETGDKPLSQDQIKKMKDKKGSLEAGQSGIWAEWDAVKNPEELKSLAMFGAFHDATGKVQDESDLLILYLDALNRHNTQIAQAYWGKIQNIANSYRAIIQKENGNMEHQMGEKPINDPRRSFMDSKFYVERLALKKELSKTEIEIQKSYFHLDGSAHRKELRPKIQDLETRLSTFLQPSQENYYLSQKIKELLPPSVKLVEGSFQMNEASTMGQSFDWKTHDTLSSNDELKKVTFKVKNDAGYEFTASTLLSVQFASLANQKQLNANAKVMTDPTTGVQYYIQIPGGYAPEDWTKAAKIEFNTDEFVSAAKPQEVQKISADR